MLSTEDGGLEGMEGGEVLGRGGGELVGGARGEGGGVLVGRGGGGHNVSTFDGLSLHCRQLIDMDGSEGDARLFQGKVLKVVLAGRRISTNTVEQRKLGEMVRTHGWDVWLPNGAGRAFGESCFAGRGLAFLASGSSSGNGDGNSSSSGDIGGHSSSGDIGGRSSSGGVGGRCSSGDIGGRSSSGGISGCSSNGGIGGCSSSGGNGGCSSSGGSGGAANVGVQAFVHVVNTPTRSLALSGTRKHTTNTWKVLSQGCQHFGRRPGLAAVSKGRWAPRGPRGK